MLKPINGNVLVRLTESLEFVETPDRQYSTKTSGVVVATTEPQYDVDYSHLVGKRVYFDEFKDGSQVTLDDEVYAFIKYEDIRGFDLE